VTDFRFHHLERRRLDQELPDLLARTYDEGTRVVVRTPSEELAAALNSRLWTYDDASFLPHGAAGDGDPRSQPIFLTTAADNPNGASVLVRLSGVEAGQEDEEFERVILLFDGGDDEAVAEARREWKRLRDKGCPVSYWREGEEGGWEQAR
jgi:DNA polymerase-3 subunit chi